MKTMKGSGEGRKEMEERGMRERAEVEWRKEGERERRSIRLPVNRRCLRPGPDLKCDCGRGRGGERLRVRQAHCS